MIARGILKTWIIGFAKANPKWLIRSATVLLYCAAIANAQSAGSGSSRPAANGNIVGTILDQSGSVTPGRCSADFRRQIFSREVSVRGQRTILFLNVPRSSIFNQLSRDLVGRALHCRIDLGQTLSGAANCSVIGHQGDQPVSK